MLRLPITQFSGYYRFLSNFFVEPDHTHVEGEYQASKTDPISYWVMLKSPTQAKAIGRKLPLRSDWEDVKVEIMYSLVLRKFQDHPSLLGSLLATGDAHLEEGNTWGDTFWGTCGGRGENMLGQILMAIRDELGRKV